MEEIPPAEAWCIEQQASEPGWICCTEQQAGCPGPFIAWLRDLCRLKSRDSRYLHAHIAIEAQVSSGHVVCWPKGILTC